MNKEITGKNKKILIIGFIGVIVIALVVVIVLLVSNNNDNSITDEKNSINTAENDTNSINDDNNNNNQVDEEIVNFANKYHYNIDAIAIVNDNSDFRNDNGFELNSIDNVKNAISSKSNEIMSLKQQIEKQINENKNREKEYTIKFDFFSLQQL